MVIGTAAFASAIVSDSDEVPSSEFVGASTSAESPEENPKSTDDLQAIISAEDVVQRSKSAFGEERYGSFWIDHGGAESLYRVAIVSFSPSDEETFRTSVSSSPRVQPYSVRFSYRELLHGADTLTSLVENLSDAAWNLGPDVERNQISIQTVDPRLPSRPAMQSFLTANPGLVFFDILRSMSASPQQTFDDPCIQDCLDAPPPDPPPNPPPTYSREAFPPYQGGLRLRVPGGSCTSGFSFNNGVWGVTAGHCGPSGEQTTIRVGTDDITATQIAWMGRNRYFNSAGQRESIVKADAGRFAPGEGQPYVIISPSIRRGVTGSYTTDNLQRGIDSCFSGVTTGVEICGEINLVDRRIDFTDGSGHYERMWCMDKVSEDGDSGSSMYGYFDTLVKAQGILSIGLIGDSIFYGPYEYTCFSHIRVIEAEMEPTLHTIN